MPIVLCTLMYGFLKTSNMQQWFIAVRVAVIVVYIFICF